MPNLITILVTIVTLFIAIRLSTPIEKLFFPLLNEVERKIPKKHKKRAAYNILSSMAYNKVSFKIIGTIWFGLVILTILLINLVDSIFSSSLSDQLFR